MKKIGLITFFNDNYGSTLQCFSTKTYIESLGFKCDLLYKPIIYTKWERIQKKIDNYVKMLLHPSIFCYKMQCRRRGRFGALNPTPKTKMLMDNFVNEKIQPQPVSNIDIRNEEWKNQYDYFITGSDQVWNVDVALDSFYFLTFAPKKKRIALATSFGISEIPSYLQKKIRTFLNGFDFISVREESGIKIVQQYSSANVTRISDPTLIFSDTEWRTLIKETDSYKSKFILVHFLNEPNEVAIESIRLLSEKMNLDIVAIGYNYNIFNSLKRLIFIDGDSAKYVSLIDQAEYVLTDSFHSTLFSINFNKKFYTFHRQYIFRPQSSRILDLLGRFNLTNRLINDIEVLKNNYTDDLPSQARETLNQERLKIRDFIQKSITEKTPQCFYR